MTRAPGVPRIRPYRPADRPALRRLCCDTADAGGSVDSLFRDREVFADLLTSYYTDQEPESCWVAEHDGEVVGYLTGCIDSRHSARAMWRIAPRVLLRALGRGVLWQAATWRLLRANLWLWFRAARHARPDPRSYPSHLHINVDRRFRGGQTGRRLLEAFLGYAARAGSPGVQLNVRADSDSARRFFERNGFRALAEYPLMRRPHAPHTIIYSVTYGKRF